MYRSRMIESVNVDALADAHKRLPGESWIEFYRGVARRVDRRDRERERRFDDVPA